ncbi:hypothetical protein F443_01793 [Phytophthora nicotianae P1569]|uniref:Uncharacterized protein n=1 Tax=Phytophthora nicotianae P1569 TaxID=1317065 RepID=V9FYS3_PHYNI|nr:hypothetical protein F443_01793 [Phytophthora nicotianae P1569]
MQSNVDLKQVEQVMFVMLLTVEQTDTEKKSVVGPKGVDPSSP